MFDDYEIDGLMKSSRGLFEISTGGVKATLRYGHFLILVYCNQQDQLLPKIHKNVKNDKTISLFNLIDNLIVKHYIQSVREGPICFRGFIFHIIH